VFPYIHYNYILICSPDVKTEVLWSSRIIILFCLDASYDLDFT
jgi:hypothetical protein